MVTITETSSAPATKVWSGSQKDLFSKYGHRALPEIKSALKALK